MAGIGCAGCTVLYCTVMHCTELCHYPDPAPGEARVKACWVMASDMGLIRLDCYQIKGDLVYLVSRVNCPSSCDVVLLLLLSVSISIVSPSTLLEREDTMSVFFFISTSSRFLEALVSRS